jgi:signal transduction histidine kinase
MKKQTTLFFYALSIYVVLQFLWWGYHLIELTQANGGNNTSNNKRIAMIVGEGGVFIILLIIGLWKIRSSIRKEFELSQRQNNFLLSITHELKTPISANKLYVQTIQKRNPNEEQRNDLLNKALKENERLEKLIDNILNAARVENRALKAIKETVNLNLFMESSLVQFRKRYPNAKIDFTSHFSGVVSLDVFMIETVLSNLIDNSMKYSGENPVVELKAESFDNKVIISVSDNGIGIDEQEQKNIFSKFYRVGNEDTRTQKGSGLGLFIAQEFLKLHNGKIHYISNKPKGSIFQITLPL